MYFSLLASLSLGSLPSHQKDFIFRYPCNFITLNTVHIIKNNKDTSLHSPEHKTKGELLVLVSFSVASISFIILRQPNEVKKKSQCYLISAFIICFYISLDGAGNNFFFPFHFVPAVLTSLLWNSGFLRKFSALLL